MKILEEILAFNSGLGCTPQEGYRDLNHALSDTKRLSIEGAVPTVNLLSLLPQQRFQVFGGGLQVPYPKGITLYDSA